LSRVGALRLAASLAVLLAAAGCSQAKPETRQADTSGAVAPAAVASPVAGKADDVLFVRRMVAHTQQGIVLAHLAATRAYGSDVRALGRRLERSQRSRMTALTRLRAGKGAAARAEQADDADEFPGLVAAGDVRALSATPAADFDWTVLTLLTEHHQGAVALASQQQREGREAGVVAVAAQIANDETAEIAAMRTTFGQS
jgi:uncharacterized protein (DUF305 family)